MLRYSPLDIDIAARLLDYLPRDRARKVVALLTRGNHVGAWVYVSYPGSCGRETCGSCDISETSC